MSSTIERIDPPQRNVAGLSGAGGHDTYFLQVLGPEEIDGIAVMSYRAAEKMGQPYRIEIVATYPETLRRDVILGHEAKFSLAPDNGSTPLLLGPDGRPEALSDDLCVCKCDPMPSIVASQSRSNG